MIDYEDDDSAEEPGVFDPDSLDVRGERSGAVVGDGAPRGYSASYEPIVRSKIAEPLARMEWASTSIAAIAYLAVVAAVFIAVTGAWLDYAPTTRASILVAMLIAPYAVAIYAESQKNDLLERVFFFLGAVFFGLAILTMRPIAPMDIFDFDALAETLRADEALLYYGDLQPPDYAMFFAIGTFALALTLPYQTLHFVAVAAALLWLGASSSRDYVGSITLVLSALGACWAWRRESRVVALLYLCIAASVFVFVRSIWKITYLPIVAFVFSALFFWFGATYKNAVARGLALVVVGLSLAALTFPHYWNVVLTPDAPLPASVAIPPVDEEVVSATTIRGPAIFGAVACSVVLILFCVDMIVSGAARSSVRLAYGIALFAIWLVSFAVVATREFGRRAAVGTLVVAAAVFMGTLSFEKALAESETLKRGGRSIYKAPSTDAAEEDDPEFDDFVDRETRETKGLGVSAYEALRIRLLNRCLDAVAVPARIAAILFQVVALYWLAR